MTCTYKLKLAGLLSAALLTISTYACPDIVIAVEDDSCANPGQFNQAFKVVYAAIYNYVDWEEAYGYPPEADLMTMALTSSEELLQSVNVDSTSVVSETTNAAYGFRRGPGGSNSFGSGWWNGWRGSNFPGGWGDNDFYGSWSPYGFTPYFGGRALEKGEEEAPEEMLTSYEMNRELQGFTCYPPKQCKDMGWCCTFCPCKNRRLTVDRADEYKQPRNDAIAREALIMEEAAMAEAVAEKKAQQEGQRKLQSNYCNWNGCNGVVEGGDWCNFSEGQCTTGCGGTWCGENDAPAQDGYCNWNGCNGVVEGGGYCNADEAHCSGPGGCGGTWCTYGEPAPPEAKTSYTDVCQWLTEQQLPGCLSGASVACSFRSQQS